MKHFLPFLLQGFIYFTPAYSFQLTKVDPGIISVPPGETVSFKCAVDGHWEFCKFTGPAPTYSECNFEWKRLANDVRIQKCQIGERVEFYGVYNDKECGMTLTNVQPEDSGVWSCHIEEYVFLGTKGSGNQVVGRMNLTVQATTTENPKFTEPTSTSTTFIEPSPTPPTVNIQETTEIKTNPKTSTTSKDEISMDDGDNMITTTEKKSKTESEEILIPTKKVVPKQDATPTDTEVIPESVPRVEEASSNMSAVIGVICAVALLGILGLAAMAWKKRQLNRQRPDAAAAVVYDREARAVNDERNMMNGGSSNNTSIAGSQQLSTKDNNYHEFFPPNLNAQSATTTYNSV